VTVRYIEGINQLWHSLFSRSLFPFFVLKAELHPQNHKTGLFISFPEQRACISFDESRGRGFIDVEQISHNLWGVQGLQVRDFGWCFGAKRAFVHKNRD